MISVHVVSREEYVRSSFLGLMVSAASLLTAEPRKVTVQSIEVWTWSVCVCSCVYTHAACICVWNRVVTVIVLQNHAAS